MTKPCGGWVPLREGITYYELWNPDAAGPWVGLIHGFSVPSFVWHRTAPALAEAGLRVLALDLYGRGASGKPRGPYTRARFVQQVIELEAALGISVAAWVGYSMGGPIAAGVLAQGHGYAGVFIAPVVTGAVVPWAVRLTGLPVVGPWLMQRFGPARMARGIRQEFQGRVDEAYVRRYLAQLADPGFLRALAETVRAGMLDDQRPVYQALASRRVPLAAVWGEADPVVPFAQLEVLASLVPLTQRFTVPEAGHLVHYEHADAVNAFLATFLREALSAVEGDVG
ncbi:MAG: alpha/beta fold hydrolase [Chloroflexi bacterium]|nr:alpha/beta fold hydrolase [Chloroflexota bacterium]